LKNILLTDPQHDKPTRSLSYWVAGVVAHIDGLKDMKAIHLKGSDVSANNFSLSVQKHQPNLVLLSGHGSHASVCGYNDEPLVMSAHESCLLFKEKIVHALACRAGHQLGQELINLGAVAFIGYKENFKFLHLTDKGDDIIASLFLEPAYEVAKSLSSGMTTEKAHRKSQKMYAKNIRKVLASGQDSSNVAAILLHDLKHHILLGNTQATI
jgi:hypothetical protein